MTINNVLSFAVFSRLSSSNDDILADRASHLYTVCILLIFSIIVGVKQFVGEPIQCFIPAQYKPAQNAYILSHCWIKNTYYLEMDPNKSILTASIESSELVYYQWVPVILLFMAFLFKLPNVIWRMLCEMSGFNVSAFVTLAPNDQYTAPDKHDEKIKNMSDYFDRWLGFNNSVLTIPPSCDGDKQKYLLFNSSKRWYILLLYLFVKILYCINVIAQFFILNKFLGNWYTMYGVELLNLLIKGDHWTESNHFPLVTFCNYKIRDQNNVIQETTQCVLPINLFTEKIFIFIWFWLVIVAVTSFLSLLKWTLFILFARKRTSFVQDYLQLINVLCGEQDKSQVKKFVFDYLKGDGVFVLKMLESNCGPVVTADIIRQLWYLYRIRPRHLEDQTQF